MEKYWIIVNGLPQGPFTSGQLKERSDFTADLPVWRDGLPEWTTVGQLDELNCYLPSASEPKEDVPEPPRAPAEPPRQPMFGGLPGMAQGAQWVRPVMAQEINGVKKPENYMVWNILATICCCLPLGIVGIVFSSMVNQKWMRGDVEGAQKASERAAWCLMVGIVLGLVAAPFQMIFNLGTVL